MDAISTAIYQGRYRQVLRDPFARESLHRVTLRNADMGRCECVWCGQPARYVYASKPAPDSRERSGS